MITKQIVATVLGILAAFVLLVGIAKLLGPLPLSISQTTTNKMSTFDVTGEGEATVAPDRAKVSMGVQLTDSTVAGVQDKGNKVINTVTSDLQKLGIDKADIKTSNYNLYPTYDFTGGSQRITGYSLNINLSVTIKDFTKINNVIDTATRDGANQVGGVSFTLSDAKMKEVEDEARTQAIQNAKDKAVSLSQLAGMRLGRIVNVSESNVSAPRPVPMFANAKDTAVGLGGAQAAPTEVSPGSTTVTVNVTLSYETN